LIADLVDSIVHGLKSFDVRELLGFALVAALVVWAVFEARKH